MATVDKLTLELEADGINSFIRAMDDAEDKLKGVRDLFEKTAKEKGVFDKELDKSTKKNNKKDKKDNEQKNKAAKTFNKNIENGTKSLDRMLKTLLAISGISFGLNALMDKSDLAAKTGTDYANQARNINASPRDLEAVNTALEMGGVSKGALNDLISKLSDNQSRFRSGRGVNPEVQQLIAGLNGWDRSGNKVESGNTDPINTLKSIAKMLQSNNDDDRKTMISMMGIGGDVGNFLSNKRVFGLLDKGYNLAIQNEARSERSQSNNAAIVGADKQLENAWTDTGEAFTPVRIALTNLATKILREVNKLTPQIEEAMPALNRIAGIILEWTKIILGKLKEFGLVGDGQLKDSEMYQPNKANGNIPDGNVNKFANGLNLSSETIDKIKDLDKKIDAVVGDRVYLTDGENYTKGSHFSGRSNLEKDYYDFVISEYQKRNTSNPVAPQTGQQLMQQSNTQQSINNSNTQSINIQEMNINTSSDNLTGIINQGVSNSIQIRGNPASLYPHLNNTK